MRLPRPATALLAGVLLLSACSSDGGDAGDALTAEDGEDNGEVGDQTVPVFLEGVETAATFGDQQITGDELRALVASTRDAALEGVPDENIEAAEADLVRGLLTQEIQIGLVRAYAAEEYGIEIDDAAVDARIDETIEAAGGQAAFEEFLASQGQTLETARERASVELLVSELQAAVAEEAGVDVAAVRAEYDLRAADGAYEASTARHILLETEEDALAALARVEGGEDFSDVAIDVSTGPSGPSGGELGSAARGAYVPAFEEAVWSDATELGVPIGPVETEFGFHVIVVDERSEQPFEEVEDALRAELLQTRAPAAFDDAINEAFGAVEVEVDPAIGDWDAAAQQVVPPSS